MASWRDVPRAHHALALLLVLVVTPAAMSVSAFLQDSPVRVGEPAPRTIVAPDMIRVPDPEATDLARREAAAAVTPVLVDDAEASAAIVQQVRDVFAVARAVRQPGDDERPASPDEQVQALRERLGMLDEDGLRLLVGLSDSELQQVTNEAVQVAQHLARQRIGEERVEAVADEQLPTELALAEFPPGVAAGVAAPAIRDALRPTVRVDEDATAQLQEAAAQQVAEVLRPYPGGSVIVSAGEVVDPVQLAALRARGLEGGEPWRALLRAAVVVAAVVAAVAVYLRASRPEVWRSSNRLVLLASLLALFAMTLEAATLLTPGAGSGWLYILPVGAVAMLATILFDPPIGVLASLPVVALVAFTVPGEPGLVAFAAVASLVSVPLVSRLSARGDLRRAAWQSTLAYAALAGTLSTVFTERPEVVTTALLAGLLSGVVTAVIVNGSLPFMESVFGVSTASSLLDLADRNHPLLRELEQRALGSYSHSIVVSTMAERAARAIGADSLLASVAALYHDIGKVRRPYFFVENQFAIRNPHDDLEPSESALIIRSHVDDGMDMARRHRLPPEVQAGIATHHGTTLISYFYRKALHRGPDGVDEAAFRYTGGKPPTKETAILMLADSCEGASRAAALHDRGVSRADLERIVRQLVSERAEDGQLDDAPLTFRDLKVVQESFIETLVGVYHPRIPYPDLPSRHPAASDAGRAAPADGPRPPVAPVEGPRAGR